MKYVNLSTTYYLDRAVQSLSPNGERFFTRALAHCGKAETRGSLTLIDAKMLGIPGVKSRISELVSAGILTEISPTEWQFDSWDVWQESGNKLLKRQENERNRQRKHREQSRDTSRDVTPPNQTREEQEITTDVVISGENASEQTPEPVEAEQPSKPAPRKRSAPPTRITEDWLPTREAVEKMQPETPLVDLKRETANMVDYWLAVPGKKGEKQDWLSTWRRWVRKAQTDAEERAARYPSRAGWNSNSSTPSGRQPTSRERKIAEQELRKSNPNPAILAQGGLTLPPNHPSLEQPRLTAIEGGAA